MLLLNVLIVNILHNLLDCDSINHHVEESQVIVENLTSSIPHHLVEDMYAFVESNRLTAKMTAMMEKRMDCRRVARF